MTNLAYRQVVDELSARIGIPNEKLFPVSANHRNICKIPAKESPIYRVVGFWTAKLVNTVDRENTPKNPQCRSYALLTYHSIPMTKSSPAYLSLNPLKLKETDFLRGILASGSY